MIRFRDCPRCGGDMVVQYGEDGCLQCGFENVDVSVVKQPDVIDGVWRGRTAMDIEVLGVGIQCRIERAPSVDSSERSRFYDANWAKMEKEYAVVCRARDKDPSWAGRVRASRLYTDFLNGWGMRPSRWCRLRKRKHHEMAHA